MSVAAAVARNTIIQTIGKIVSIALGWFIVLTMTNYLGAEGFGAYTIMTTYLQFFAVAVDLGFVLVSSQLLAESQNVERTFANLFTFRLCTSLIILALAPFIIWFLPYTTVVKEGVVVLTISFFLVALLQVFVGLFQKELAIGRAIAGELMGRVVLLLVVLMATVQHRSILFMVVGVVVGSVANFSLAAILARRFVRLRLAYDAEVWRLIWQRSWPLALGIVFNLIYLKADTLILSLTRTQAEVGVYGAMYRVLEVLVTFPTMFVGLLLPLMSVAWARGNRQEFQNILQAALDTVLYVAWPMVVGVTFTASRLTTMFGSDFSQAGWVLWLLVVATAVIFIGTFFGHVVVAVGKQRSMIGAYALTAVFGLTGYLVFIPTYGAYGAAAMTLVAELFVATLAYVVVRRVVGISPSFAKLGVALTASLPMALYLWLGASLPLLVLIGGAVLMYVAALYLMGALPRELLRAMFATTLSPSEPPVPLRVMD